MDNKRRGTKQRPIKVYILNSDPEGPKWIVKERNDDKKTTRIS